ncbi:nucleotidyltransferase family protein [Nocardioides jensenii]|uniref:nucleotidyltransferase family protein n=1 Tax=Nocardioides jensenii TaxID=1843 RepID=UPI00082BD812|nr:nucleotidyltransferase family protein [Nocardioides jensenii]
MTAAVITSREAVLLCTAFADRLATAYDVRALVIKGHALEEQGLRGLHYSVDVDLLVDPSAYDRFLGLLAEHGWKPMTPSTAPSIIERHAVTVLHESWPISIDVHSRFPGFLTDPQAVFDELWRRRTSARVAGVEVAVPDRVGHAAVVALHYLRDPRSGKARHSLPDLVERVRTTFTEADRQELVALAADTGASQSLGDFLVDVGATHRDVTEPEALAAWRLRTHVGGSAAWTVGLSSLPFRRRPAEIWHAVMLSREEIAAYHQADGESVGRARRRRLRRGLRQVPVAVVAVSRFKHQSLRGL